MSSYIVKPYATTLRRHLCADHQTPPSDAQITEAAREIARFLRGGNVDMAKALELGRDIAGLTKSDARLLGRIQWELHKALLDSQGPCHEDAERHLAELIKKIVRGFILGAGAPIQAPNFVEDDGEFLRTIIDCVLDPIFVKDEQHRWIFMNQAFCELMGEEREVLLGKSDYDFLPPEQADVFWRMDNEVLTTLEPNENEETLTDTDGQHYILSTKKSALWDFRGRKLLVGIIRDITARRRLESQLKVTERLVTVGTLAAGVAHEINNPLAIVQSNLDFVREELEANPPEDEELLKALASAQLAATRVQHIVHGLKTFAEPDEEVYTPQNLNEIVQAVVNLMQNDIHLRARLNEDYGETPAVWTNAGRLGQVFLNLVLNAIEAIEPGHAHENELSVQTSEGPQNQAIVTIIDTGTGISEDILDRIFDPFFTTKPVGEGTGLGLSIAHNIVKALGGRIEVESTPARGSRFTIYLPGVDPAP